MYGSTRYQMYVVSAQQWKAESVLARRDPTIFSFAFASALISDNQHDIGIILDRVLGLAWFGRPKGVFQAISGPSSFKVKTSLAKACWT